ncbi:hypothetical protein H072_8768 [Dactylellina haptotyla CBS 200.50]|uniref:Uncharacterized protein n=1 Tax=Dactylellina haptotyla (strain CBS 200.50) TaxID=1284197 RepID=S8BE51_DACHA|nr:hypothetical protein H072_8768 [Dactylellina haptotyla CBS 200.50]
MLIPPKGKWACYGLYSLSLAARFVNAVTVTGFVPLSEFEFWLNNIDDYDENASEYLDDISKDMTLLFTDFFPPSPTFVLSTLPPALQIILTTLSSNLTELQASGASISPPLKSHFSAKKYSEKVLKALSLPFPHREDAWPSRPREKQALTPTHPSVFSVLQEFSNHLATSNITYTSRLPLLLWLYDAHITQRQSGSTVHYHTDARPALTQIFGRFYTMFERMMILLKDIPYEIKADLADKWSYDKYVNAQFQVLLSYVRKISRATYSIYWHMLRIRITPEIGDVMWNPSKPARYPYLRQEGDNDPAGRWGQYYGDDDNDDY